MDTLAVQLTLPTTKRVVDFHHQAIAHAGRTGKTTTKQPMNKTPQDIWNDLAYIDNNLVLFALMRKGITSLTEEAMKGVISEMNHGRSI